MHDSIPEKLTLHEISRQLGETNERLNSLEEKIDPVLLAYQSAIFTKNFIVGIASIAGAIAVIGGAVLWFYDHFHNH